MAFVRQRGRKDCGVAALAMLCNVTYEEAEAAIPNYKKGRGTRTRQLIAGAKRLNYHTDQTRLRPLRLDHIGGWTGIETNTLVKIPHPTQKGDWHWVVWRKCKVYDPARGVFKPHEYPGGKPTSRLRFWPHRVGYVGERLAGSNL